MQANKAMRMKHSLKKLFLKKHQQQIQKLYNILFNTFSRIAYEALLEKHVELRFSTTRYQVSYAAMFSGCNYICFIDCDALW